MERSRLWTDDSEPEPEPEATDSGGDWARWRFAVDLEAGVLDEDAIEEDFADGFVTLLVLGLGLGLGLDAVVDGPALGARLGGLKGSRRFFCAGGSPVMFSAGVFRYDPFQSKRRKREEIAAAE